MDLATKYLGLNLPSPLVVGASPLSDDLDGVRRLEDAGASCIVLRSLFEEQITREKFGTLHSMEIFDPSNFEAISCFPKIQDFVLGPDEYLEHIRRIKEAVRVPIVGSLNGIHLGDWLKYAHLIEKAGADALELNVFFVATNPNEPPAAVEKRTTDIARVLKKSLGIPLAVKLSPFFSSLPDLVRQLDASGIDGVVLFNRFYQPFVNGKHRVAADPRLSDPSELSLRLRWLSILSATVQNVDLAVSGGVHSSADAIRAILSGATAVQVVSALLRTGRGTCTSCAPASSVGSASTVPNRRAAAVEHLRRESSPDPQVFSRANYIRLLQSWHD
jgi:dihydroorotate dehydrogenase (fumarate)